MRALTLALLVSLPLAAPAAQSGEKPSPRGDETSARAALQARFDAALRADVPALDKLLADDLEYCGVSATCSTKAQYLESVRNGTRKFKSLVPKVERVTMYADSAVLTGKVYALSIGDGTERQVDAYFLVVLAWRDGRWQMTNQSSTLLQPTPE
jgi:ketosteroid isomerase-like protein